MSQSNVKQSDSLPRWRIIEPNPWAVFLIGGFFCALLFWAVVALGLLAGGAG